MQNGSFELNRKCDIFYWSRKLFPLGDVRKIREENIWKYFRTYVDDINHLAEQRSRVVVTISYVYYA